MNTSYMFRTLCLLSAFSLSLVSMASEEEAVVADTTISRFMNLDEVLIVQPKEAQPLRQQPLSSTTIGLAEMQSLNVSDLTGLASYVPSMAMPTYGSRLTSAIYVRGMGSRLNTAAPSVPVYYDNMPLMSKSAFNTHFTQIEYVDILRGPQSTLYGINSESGLVRIYSANPLHRQGTDIRLGVANGSQRKAEIAHMQKLTDNVGLSLSAFYNAQDGFFRNTNLDAPNDKMTEAGGKLRLVANIGSRLTADLTSDYQFTFQNAFPYGSYDISTGDVALPSTTFMNRYKRNMVNTGLTLSYHGDKFLASSTTSYQHLYDDMTMDQDYTAAPRMSLFQTQKHNAFTEELSVRSTHSGRWQWVFGAFGSHLSLDTDAPVVFGPSMNDMLAGLILSVMPPAAQAMFSVWEIPENAVAETFSTPQTNMAVFHESNIRLTDRLTATLGLRFDYAKAQIDYNSQAQLVLHYAAAMGPRVIEQSNKLTSLLINSHESSSAQLLPKVGLKYDLPDGKGNVYTQLSKGYRAGGYNIQMFSDILSTEMQSNGTQLRSGDYDIAHTDDDYDAVNNTISYDPEESWSFELGTHLNLLGKRLQADLSTYYMRIRNQQLSVMAGTYGFGRMMVNAGKSASCGIEAALKGVALNEKLSWAASYSYTRAVFKEYLAEDPATGAAAVVDYKDNKVPFVPEHIFSAMADYQFDVKSDEVLRSVTVGLNLSGNGKTFWDEANTFSQDFYAQLGAHVRFDLGKVDLDFWGRNLTDTRYNTFAVYSSGYFAQRGLPLQLGADLRLRF